MNDSALQQKKGCGLCAILFLVFIIGIGIVLLSAFGVIRIPWLSDVFQSQKKAVRQIVLSEADREQERVSLENKIGDIAFLMRTATPENPADISLTVTERELTALLLSGSETLPLSDAQVVVESDGIEVSGRVTQPVEGLLLIKVKPVVKDGAVDFNIQEVSIGGLSVPRTLADSVVKTALGKKLEEANTHIKNAGEIKAIELDTGELTLSARVMNGSNIFEQNTQ